MCGADDSLNPNEEIIPLDDNGHIDKLDDSSPKEPDYYEDDGDYGVFEDAT